MLKIIKLNKFSKIFLFLFFFFVHSVPSIADKSKNFEIVGNNSISNETILSFLPKNKKKYDLNDFNQFKKELHQTNYFSKVDIEIFEKKILITVLENPLIDYFFIDGVKNKDLLKKLNKLVSLEPNNFFSESFIKKDVTKLTSYLSAIGYYDNDVSYIVKKNNDNRVNIFYNINLNQKYKISNIFFIGDKYFSSSTLADVISSSKNSWFSFFSDSSIPSKERLNFDKSLLKKFYSERGYFDSQISDALIEIRNKNETNLTFIINAGKKFKISKVNLTDNTSSSLSKKNLDNLKKYIFLLENQYYNPKHIRDLSEKILKYLDVNNIPVISDVNLTKVSNNSLTLSVILTNELNKKIINQIVVSGNNITEEKVIRNNLFFAEGDRFAKYFLDKSRDNLKSLGIFKTVKLTKENIKNSNNININLEVEEDATGEIGAGAGFGTTGAVISFNFKEKNYLGQGVLADMNLSLGTDRSVGSILYVEPDFANTGISLSNNLFITETSYDTAGYENKSIGLNSNIESEVFKDVYLMSGIGIQAETIETQLNATNLIKSQNGDFLTTKFFYNFKNDKRDTKFETKSGYMFGFGQDFASFFSDRPFFSNKVFGTFYHELHENFVGTVRYKFASINSLNNKDVKLSDRLFFLENDLRGFKFRGFGPVHQGDYIGGNYSYAGSIATTFPNALPDKWGIKSNVFLDTGNLWGADLDSSADRNQIRSSIGTGLSWRSPLGPLSITYAEPITKASSDKIEKFNFKIGTNF